MPAPPAADLAVEPEPPYPIQAITAPTEEERQDAEDAWDDEVRVWGGRGWAQVARLCRWAVDVTRSTVQCPASSLEE
ncbi:hypothetical protein WJT74_05240 [Sphingomicrobium sp. XHP0239]|uniref:hypothetical protein n=1 Tax=Sphingomicrobium maritimum TaxID=3133972 RepID=UPI0031CCD637